MDLLRGIFGKNKEKPLPTGPVADAFKEYISNEIPSRFINTSTMQFVSRKDVFRFFQDEIASVTETQIRERVSGLDNGPFVTYAPLHEDALRQIIQEVVKYAILSHRWDQTAGEPSFQDISGGSIARFKKLRKFCKTAHNLGYRLAWVDSCCIDQTNATEVSEAIHAMYKWYAHSHLCISHLAGSTSLADWDSDMWFTRGWTLQELLAPKRLKFYTRDWKPLIPRDEVIDDRQYHLVMYSVKNITGISERVLNADNTNGVRDCSFWEIMSWASKRQTTRAEDKAYCLIGLFRVHLPISYGEGQRAFPRLVKAILTQNPCWGVFAWSGQPCPFEVALPPSPDSYAKYEPGMSEGRAGVQGVSFTAYSLSLKALPLILLELGPVEDPTEPNKPYLVELRPQPNNSLGTFGNLIVKCGATRLKTMREAMRLSACIMNHHPVSGVGTRREQSSGKLVAGEEYICFLLYSNEGGSETAWLKLTTDNLLRITFVEIPKEISRDEETAMDARALPLVTTVIRS